MTAGIVVMNSGAVALATDSAVTIPYGTRTKHYKGACKLSTVHRREPVAIMWYGSPDYLGVPWEVIVKEFRRDREETHPRLVDYANSFLAYVETVNAWAPSDGDEPNGAILIQGLLRSIAVSIENRQGSSLEDGVTRAVSSWENSLSRRKQILTKKQVKSLKRLHAWLDDEMTRLGELNEPLPAPAKERIRRAAGIAWGSISEAEPLHTGLVFAGYGTEERLPAMCSHLVGVPVESTPRRLAGDLAEVSSQTPAAIFPFAESDVVRLFLEGIQPDLTDRIGGMMSALEADPALQPIGQQIKDLLRAYIDEQGRPVTEAVRFLPKADLAEFAQKLIAFTAFRLRMSMAVETVSEPIDVAVVSRSEGFVWVHRSHYFEASLNPRYFRRYGLQ